MTVAERTPRQTTSLLFWVALLWAAAGLAFVTMAIFAKFYDYFAADVYLAHQVQRIDVAGFGGFMDFVNFIGSDVFFIVLTLALAGGILLLRAPIASVIVLLAIGPRVLNSAVKEAVARPRPSSDLVNVAHHEGGYGFPSGHTVGTAALFGALFFVIPALVSSRPLRWLLQLGCLLLIVAAGPARVYTGAHWPSDVAAGYLLALMFLIPAVVTFQFLTRTGNRSQAEARLLD